MGVNLAFFGKLAEMSRAGFRPSGRSVMLGRQKFRLRQDERRSLRAFGAVLRRHGIAGDIAEFAQPDNYAETLFRRLGFGQVESLDASAFEGAGIIWDLNQPVPDTLRGKFGFVVDGGTLEHVFDVRQALDNVADMLMPGGRFLSVSPLNGYPGHGFYQFSPEIVWTYWRSARGFIVHDCRAMAPNGGFDRPLPDPVAAGRRLSYRVGPAWLGRFPASPVVMCYEVEKPVNLQGSGTALQSDYEQRWKSA